jgi:CRISP-associated protein Cas1
MQNRIVEIATDGAHLSAERGFLNVTKNRELLGRIAIDDVAGLVIRGYGASFSANICAAMALRNAPIVICSSDQSPSSVIWPVAGHYQQGLHMQAQAVAKKPLLKRLWAELVTAKITAQATVLRNNGKDFDDIEAMASRVRSGDPDNMEAQAARRYWSRLMGQGFTRDRQQDGINAALNYGYTVLRAASARSIIAAGLHPSLSIQHQSRGDALRLADDLMEPFRPFVDQAVVDCVSHRPSGNQLELTKETKAKLVEVLSLDLIGPLGASPVQTCMDRLAQSLVSVFVADRQSLELPDIKASFQMAKQ